MEQKPKDRLQLARVRAGYDSPAAFAARHADDGIVESTYRSYENGNRELTLAAAKKIAPLLKTTWAWLLDGGADPMSTTGHIQDSVSKNRPIVTKTRRTALSKDKIEVLGMVECGPDGWALWNGEVVDWVDRPANMQDVPKAYAVFIVGDSMEPRYFPGELAFVHPGKPVTIGAFVVMQMVPPEEGGPPRAFLKRLVKRTGNKLIFEQLNPKKLFTITTDQIQSMHRVVGSGEP